MTYFTEVCIGIRVSPTVRASALANRFSTRSTVQGFRLINGSTIRTFYALRCMGKHLLLNLTVFHTVSCQFLMLQFLHITGTFCWV